MNLIKQIISTILNLTAFLLSLDGRIGRGMYWLLNLILLIYLIILRLIARVMAAITDPLVLKLNASESYLASNVIYAIVYHFPLFLIMWITSSIQLKRYHDLDKSGWWQLILIILAFKILNVGVQWDIVPMIIISAIIISWLQIIELGTFKKSNGIDYGARNTFKDVIKNEGLVNMEKLTGVKLLKLFFLMFFIYSCAQIFRFFLSISLG